MQLKLNQNMLEYRALNPANLGLLDLKVTNLTVPKSVSESLRNVPQAYPKRSTEMSQNPPQARSGTPSDSDPSEVTSPKPHANHNFPNLSANQTHPEADSTVQSESPKVRVTPSGGFGVLGSSQPIIPPPSFFAAPLICGSLPYGPQELAMHGEYIPFY